MEGSGNQVVAHAGLHALGPFADRVGLGDGLSAAMPLRGERLPLHDRGKVLVQAMLMLAGGGESCADIEVFRSQDRIFTEVCSDTTLWRVLNGELTPEVLDGLRAAVAGVRRQVWDRSTATGGSAGVYNGLCERRVHQSSGRAR